MRGAGVKAMLPEERAFGRREGLYAARPIAAGKVFDTDDIAVKRPAAGLRARYRDRIIGSVAKRNIETGEPID